MKRNSIDSGETINIEQTADESYAFLYRIERQRLDSECLRPLDLRPHTKGPFKHFSYRGRSLWLDQESLKVFLEGLRNNTGVFTVETYETILRKFVGGDINPNQIETERVCAANDSELLLSSVLATASSQNSDSAIDKNTIDLSYFEKRREERIKITLNVNAIWMQQSYAAQTRDISKSGMQLRLKVPIDVSVNDTISVNLAPSSERELDQPILHYRVVHVRHLLQDTLLSLESIDNRTKDGLSVISDLIISSSKTSLTKQNDPGDALLSAQALLAERYYMRSTSILPFFMFECQEDESPLRIIFANQVNRRHLAAFKNSQGIYDFDSLVTPKRIKLLTRLALRDSKADTLIAVFRSHLHSEPQVIADLECKNHKHWSRLLMRYVDQREFRVFKVVARLAHQPVMVRLENALEPLPDNVDERARRLLEKAKTLSVVGSLIDVTEQMSNWIRSENCYDLRSCEDMIICCDKEKPLAPPKLVPINYIQENRCEDRFLGRMQVEVSIADRVFQGVSRDVSAHGLSVKIDDPDVSFINQPHATLSFPKLEARNLGLVRFQGVYRDVPAELVGGPSDGERLLRFKISDVDKGRLFSKSFSEFLVKRRSGLSLDESHIMRAFKSRIYSSIFIESSSTLPVFIYRNSHDSLTCRFGRTTCPTPLMDFLEIADGKFDFSFISNSNRLQRITQQLSVSGSSELTIYLCKERLKDAASFKIRSLAAFEIDDEDTLGEFVQHAMEHDFRSVKVILTKPDIPPIAEIEQAVARLSQLSPSRSKRLTAEFEKLIAIGDVVDITGLAAETGSEEQTVSDTDELSTIE
jgi:hypothetical protein